MLSYLDVEATTYGIKEILSHPLFPNIRSVQFLLHKYGINSVVGKNSYEGLCNLPMPVLLHIKSDGGKLYNTPQNSDHRFS